MIQIVSGTFISVDLFIHYGSVTNKNELWISMLTLHWTFYWVPQCFSSTCLILVFSESPETKVFTSAFCDLNFPYSLFHILLVLGCHTSLTTHISSCYHTQSSLTIFGLGSVDLHEQKQHPNSVKSRRYDLGKVMLEWQISHRFWFCCFKSWM